MNARPGLHMVDTWRDRRHYVAPRTFDESTRGANYASAIERERPGRVRGWLLATAIGVGMAWWLFTFWSE